MTSQLHVVIPTAGTSDLLDRTLASLAACQLPENYRRTMVVENGPRAGGQQAADKAPPCLRTEYFYVEQANKSNALNRVFATIADKDLVYLIDDDIRLASHVLVDFSTAAAGKDRGFVFGGPLRIDSEQPPPVEFLEFLPGSMKGWEPHPEDFDPLRDFFLGANWAIFAGDMKRAGGFDPRFGPGSPLNATGQEWSMQRALRAQQATFQYLPQAVVWHHVDFSRFSSDFLRQRKFRGGLEAGIQAADRYLKPLRLRDRCRFPASRAHARRWTHAALAKWFQLASQPHRQLKHELLREHARGFLQSFRQSVQQNS